MTTHHGFTLTTAPAATGWLVVGHRGGAPSVSFHSAPRFATEAEAEAWGRGRVETLLATMAQGTQ